MWRVVSSEILLELIKFLPSYELFTDLDKAGPNFICSGYVYVSLFIYAERGTAKGNKDSIIKKKKSTEVPLPKEVL